MRVSMQEMLNDAEERLLDIVLHQERVGRAPRYIDAIREMRLKKDEIQVRFENRFAALFEQQAAHLPEGDLYAIDFSGQTLTPEKVAIAHAAGKARTECRTALASLDKQFSAMLEDPEEADNPVQPEIILEAFWESCRDVGAGVEVRMLLVELFERYIVSGLPSLYEDVSRYLQNHSLNIGNL
jgi:hypothetical protein